MASVIETDLFQWLFGGFIFVVIRRVHVCGYSEGSFSERLHYYITIARLKFNRPIELQSGSGFKIQDLEEKFPWNLES